MSYKLIALSLIDTEGQSVREAMDDDHVVELAMSIAKHGLLQPIVLKPKDDGRYQLEAGFHRLSAFHRLKRTEIPSYIKTDDTGPVKAIALVENVCRKDMTLQEEIDAVNYLHETEKLSPSQICDITGKGRSWVDRRLGAKNLPDDLKEELFNGTLSLGHVEALAFIQDYSARRYATANVITTRLTVPQTRDLVAVYLETPSIEEAVKAGIQKKEELQAQKDTLRTCELCGEPQPIERIRFIPVCTDPAACVQRQIAREETLKRQDKE